MASWTSSEAPGLGDKVDSWVSTEPNQQVEPAALGQALGPDTVQKMSSHTGLDVGQLLPLLAAALPQLVNMLTPNGNVPSGGLDQAAGPNIGGLLGGLLGGSGGTGSGSGELENVLGGLGGMLGGNRGGTRTPGTDSVPGRRSPSSIPLRDGRRRRASARPTVGCPCR